MPIYATEQGWVLETRQTGYALGLNSAGRLVHRYWGVRLPYPEDYPTAADFGPWASFNAPAQRELEEYPAYAGASYVDPCLKATFADGVRDVVLRLDAVEQGDASQTELHIRLRDTWYPFFVTLHYRVHADYQAAGFESPRLSSRG